MNYITVEDKVKRANKDAASFISKNNLKVNHIGEYEVDIIDLAKQMNVHVDRIELPDNIYYYLKYENNQYNLMLNQWLNWELERFVIANALGHIHYRCENIQERTHIYYGSRLNKNVFDKIKFKIEKDKQIKEYDDRLCDLLICEHIHYIK